MKKALLKSSIFMAIAGWVLCIGAPALAAERFQLEYGDRGLMSLKWAGQDILKDGKPSVGRIVLEKKTLADDGINEYDWQKPDVSEPRVKTERDGRRLVYTYKWGTITFNYTSAPDRLELTTTIQNKADRTMAMFEVKPFTLSLPDPLDKPKHWKRIANMPGDFNVVQAVYGEHKLLLCCETVMPLHFGFGKPRKKNTVLPVTMRGNVNITRPGGVVYYHYGLPRIAPGKSLRIKMSLRITDVETDNEKVIPDMYEAFRAYHTPRMTWMDRRPIGAIFMTSGRGPANNPRNWFRDKKLDVRTEEGKKKLRERMMKHADRCINVLKATNAQGMVLWNPEGGENPHPITYIGDPRMVPLVAPEMADIYPDYFKKFTEAGLRTGCCLRPSQVYMTPFTNACDGDITTRWSVQDAPQWLEVDFGKDRKIDRSEVICFSDRAYQYKIEAKTEGGKYSLIVDRTENKTPGTAESPITDKFEPVKARYVKLTITGAHKYEGRWCSIREFRIYSGKKKLALNNAADCSRRFGRTVGGHLYNHNPERDPLDQDYSDIWPEGVPSDRFFPIVERMCRKIEWAKKHWGCTIFYVDTNGVKRPVGEKQKIKWSLLDPHIWREISRRHPDVLLIPEFAHNPGQLAYTSCYLQPPYSPPVTRSFWRELLPGAFSVSYTVNLKKEKWNGMRDRLLKGIREGDSLFFRGWFGDAYNKKIKALYDEVYEPGAINPGLPESYLKAARTKESPH